MQDHHHRRMVLCPITLLLPWASGAALTTPPGQAPTNSKRTAETEVNIFPPCPTFHNRWLFKSNKPAPQISRTEFISPTLDSRTIQEAEHSLCHQARLEAHSCHFLCDHEQVAFLLFPNVSTCKINGLEESWWAQYCPRILRPSSPQLLWMRLQEQGW